MPHGANHKHVLKKKKNVTDEWQRVGTDTGAALFSKTFSRRFPAETRGIKKRLSVPHASMTVRAKWGARDRTALGGSRNPYKGTDI
jgi:hypothetical protein